MLNFSTIAAFLIGMGSFIHYYLGVRLSVSEISLPLSLLLFSNTTMRAMKYPQVARVIFFLVLHMIAVPVSDYLNEVDVLDSAKSLARPMFMLLFFLVGLGIALSHPVGFYAFLLGYLFGATLHFLFNTGNDLFDFEGDVTGYSFFVFRVQPMMDVATILALTLLAKWKVHRYCLFSILIVISVISLRYGARSSFLVWLVVAMVYSAQTFMSPAWIQRNSRSHLAMAMFAILISSFSYLSYSQLAVNGFLGEMKQRKFEDQGERVSDNIPIAISLMARGRPEAVTSILKIIDSPIVGHGSSSYDWPYIVRAYELAGSNLSEVRNLAVGNVAGGHSVMLHAWAANGVLTFPFYALCLYILYTTSVRNLGKNSMTTCLVVFFSGLIAWDLIFSPLSVQYRCLIPVFLAYCIVDLGRLPQRLYEPFKT